ncbi:hypothetical protein B0H34DRAFT_341849 [Crassisporium funariophilum]|nr:hypothetical protein B0H34DRAFT_341849 [Crassisporium funariophilum]
MIFVLILLGSFVFCCIKNRRRAATLSKNITWRLVRLTGHRRLLPLNTTYLWRTISSIQWSPKTATLADATVLVHR